MPAFHFLVLDTADHLPAQLGIASAWLKEEHQIECVRLTQTRQVLGALAAGTTDLIAIGSHRADDEGQMLLHELHLSPNLLGRCKLLLHCTRDVPSLPGSWPTIWQLLRQPELDVPELANMLRTLLNDLKASTAEASSVENDFDWAVQYNFGGNQAIYQRFRASVLTRLPVDIERMELALQQRDLGTLHRLSHDCKSLLAMLGYRVGSAMALELERLAHGLDQTCAASAALDSDEPWQALRSSWSVLRSFLRSLASNEQISDGH